MFQVKEVRIMKETKELLKKALKKVAETSLTADANRTSCAIVFQPKVPAKLKDYKKTNI